MSHYLDGEEYKQCQKNTVQSLFPLIVPDIPEEHKNSILALLKDVFISLLRKNIINQIILFPRCQDLISPITLYSLLI